MPQRAVRQQDAREVAGGGGRVDLGLEAAGARQRGSAEVEGDAEVGVERYLSPENTPDGRPGAGVLLFAFSADGREIYAVAQDRGRRLLFRIDIESGSVLPLTAAGTAGSISVEPIRMVSVSSGSAKV